MLEIGVFWWISYPTHMKSMLSGFLESQVHHRRAERGVSITLPSLRQSNFGKLQFGFVLADFQISSAAVAGQTFFSKAAVCTEGWMSGEQLNLQIAFYQIVHRNIDKDMAWLLPLLVDKAGMIKAPIFVLRKDTADILGRKITNGTKTYR